MQINWEKLFEKKDVNYCYDLFLSQYDKTCKSNAPLKSKSIGKGKLWCFGSVKKLIKEKNFIWRNMKKSEKKNKEIKHEYNRISKHVKKVIKRVVREFENDLANKSKNNPKLVYQYINSKKKVKEKIRMLKNKNGDLVVNEIQIAEELNRQFQSVFVDETPDNELPPFQTRTEKVFDSECILSSLSPESIQVLLSNLDSDKMICFNNVHPLNVSPIFKSQSRMEAANYRPVSLTSLVCKVLEKVIRSLLIRFLEDNKFLADEQHGFV